MAATILLALVVTLAQARLMPPLPPIVVRDGIENVYDTVKNANISSGHNATYPGVDVARNYDTVAYKMYIVFMILGAVTAALILSIVYCPSIIHWWRQKRHQKALKHRKEDVVEATMRMRRMRESMPPAPPEAYLRPERAVRPGTNFF